MPMFEDGKTWKYVVHDEDSWGFTEPKADFERWLRVDGMTKIDGLDYFVVNAYSDGAETPDGGVPMGYFREDTETGKIYFLPESRYDATPINTYYWSENQRESLLIDFRNIEGCGILGSESASDVTHAEDALQLADGTHKGIRYKRDSNVYADYGCYEGLGLVAFPKGESAFFHKPFLLPGFVAVTSDGKGQYPYLYRIEKKDGTVIFSIPQNNPAGLESIAQDEDAVEISFSDGVVTVKGGRSLGDITVTDMTGKTVATTSTSACRAEIPTKKLQPGIYVITCSSATAKIVLR